MRLADGRRLALQEYGDPAAPPVLYFHGWPASRLEAGMIPAPPARILAFDRPGYGGSTPSPGRTLLDWPRDVTEVADRLGLGRFHIVGLSGGAPYAAACALVMPDRVRGVALVCPVPPAHCVPPRAPGIGQLFRLGRHPVLARRLLGIMGMLLRHRVVPPRMLVGWSLAAPDRSVLGPAMLATLAAAWREGMGRSVEGALSDAQLFAAPWRIPFPDIRVPVDVWHGADDALIPPQALAPFDAIPRMRLHVVPGEGHFSLAIRHAPAILQRLMQGSRDECAG